MHSDIRGEEAEKLEQCLGRAGDMGERQCLFFQGQIAGEGGECLKVEHPSSVVSGVRTKSTVERMARKILPTASSMLN